MIRHAFGHGSPEHWRGRRQFRASTGWDPEEVFEPGDYVVAPADDGAPTVALGVGAYRKLREVHTDPANLAWLDQTVAHLTAENAEQAREAPDGW